MRFPLVTLAHHEETVALWKSRYESAEKERRELVDYLLRRSTGHGLFEELNHPTPIQPAQSPYYINPRKRTGRDVVREMEAQYRKLEQDAESATPSEGEQVVLDTIKEALADAQAGK